MIKFTLLTGEIIYINKINLVLVYIENIGESNNTILKMNDNLNYPVIDTIEEALIKLE